MSNVNGSKNMFLFGIGLGEQVDYLFKRFKKAKITVWDRDPWLIRLALMQRDYSHHLRSGRLQLCMGADILDMTDTAKVVSVICHPFLRLVYENEYELLKCGVGEKRAIICS